MKITGGIDVANINTLSDRDFKEIYFIPQKPVVIKGLVDQCPAGKKWSFDYLKDFCGDVIVELFDNNNKNVASAYTNGDRKMKFRDYIDIRAPLKTTF